MLSVGATAAGVVERLSRYTGVNTTDLPMMPNVNVGMHAR